MSPTAFCEFLVSLSLQAAILIGVTAAVARTRLGRPHAHRLWGACHASILLLTLAGVLLPHFRLLPGGMRNLFTDLPQWERAETIIGLAAASIWGTVAGVLLLRLGRDLWRVRMLARYATAADFADPETANSWKVGGKSARVLVARQQPGNDPEDPESAEDELARSADPCEACCWQIQHPHILLPGLIRDLPPAQRDAMVRHELAHLRAGHPLHLFLQRICLAVFWFHPLVWWSAGKANLARELHCDREAISNAREAVDYLESLLALAERSPQPAQALALRFRARRADVLAERIARITARDWADVKTPSRVVSLAMVYATAFAAWFLWAPLDAAGSPRVHWSPWPAPTAQAVKAVLDYPLRDYEPDAFRTREHSRQATAVRK